MTPIRNLATILLCGAAALILHQEPANTAESALIHHKTVFDVRFGSLPVGTATFDVRFNDKRYELGANGKTVGIAELFASGKGTADSAGRIDGDKVVAQHSDAVFFEKETKSSVHMEFDKGVVTKVDIVAAKKRNRTGPKWVQVNEGHLRAVMDPASSIIIPVAWELANDPKAVCNRTLNVYDGETRYDIALEYKSTKPVSTQGYDGYAYVCRLRYVPVAGHRKNQKNVDYMSRNLGMEIWLAPMARTNLFSPIRIEVPTWIGRVSAVPSYFGTATD